MKDTWQLILLIVLMSLLFSGCENSTSGSSASSKNGSRDQAKNFQKKEPINGETASRRKPSKNRDNKKKTNVRVHGLIWNHSVFSPLMLEIYFPINV